VQTGRGEIMRLTLEDWLEPALILLAVTLLARLPIEGAFTVVAVIAGVDALTRIPTRPMTPEEARTWMGDEWERPSRGPRG